MPKTLADVSSADVISAIKQVDAFGLPDDRRSRKFCLLYDGKHYAPKAILSLATGNEMGPQDFGGGAQSNSCLTGLGFTVVRCKCGGEAMRKYASAGTDVAENCDEARVARLVLRSSKKLSPDQALKCLTDVLKLMLGQTPIDVVLTPAGFIKIILDLDLPVTGWETPASALTDMRPMVVKALKPLLSGLAAKSQTYAAKYVLLGVDVYCNDGRQAQLVVTADVNQGAVVEVTGKSYPLSGFETTNMAQIADITSHCQTLDGKKYLVLCCHDLNFVQPRTPATGARKKRAAKMLRVFKKFNASTVLQPAHETDTYRSWLGGWSKLKRLLNFKIYATGVRYTPGEGSQPLVEVLRGTSQGITANYLWSPSGARKL